MQTNFLLLSLATKAARRDPCRHLWPPSTTSIQKSAFQLQQSPTTAQQPHSGGSGQPERRAATGRRRGGGGRGSHRAHRHGADSRGQQWRGEQEAELRRAGRDLQWRVGQRRASCCQFGVWSGTNDLLSRDYGMLRADLPQRQGCKRVCVPLELSSMSKCAD